MSNDYSDQKLYSEKEILDVLRGLDVVYQSKSWIGKRLWFPWHLCLETIAVMLTSAELQNQETITEMEMMLRKESGEDDDNL